MNKFFRLASLAYVLLALLQFNAIPYVNAQVRALSDPEFDQALNLYQQGDYRNALPLFKHSSDIFPEDPTSSYYYAITLQRVGYLDKAVAKYQQLLDRFPDTEEGRRALTALYSLSPAYAQRWRAAHKDIGISSSNTDGVAPDIWTGLNVMTKADTWHYNLVDGKMIIDARIHGKNTKAIFDPKAKLSTIGRNNMRALLMADAETYGKTEKDPIWTALASVGRFHRKGFPFHITDSQTVPVLGSQFVRDYKVTINPAQHAIQIAWRPEKPNEEKQRISQNFRTDFFEVPFHRERPVDGNLGMMIVNVGVDGSNVPMEFSMSGTMTMSTAQLRQIDPSYFDVGDPEVSMSGTLMTTERVVQLKRVTLGKITKYKVPCNVLDFNSARYQAYKYDYSQYPRLGSDFAQGWEIKVDEKRQVINFSKRSEVGTHIDGNRVSP